MDAVKIPENSLNSYIILFYIENVLRELIIISLSELDGPKWYKRRLPGDILDKYRNSVMFEKSIPWTTLVPHHPYIFGRV